MDAVLQTNKADRSTKQSLTFTFYHAKKLRKKKKKKKLPAPQRAQQCPEMFKIMTDDKAEFSLFERFQNITHGAKQMEKCQLSLMHPINGENGKWRM